MNEALTYSDVYLIPSSHPCEIESRGFCDTSIALKDVIYKTPIIPSNMLCTIDASSATTLAKNHCPYVMHRFGKVIDLLKSFDKILFDSAEPLSFSIGVQKSDYAWLKLLCSDTTSQLAKQSNTPWIAYVSMITIDVAHGHHILVKNMISELKQIRKDMKLDFAICAGNIGSAKAALDLAGWGADIVKVGIAPGKACTTYNSTGVCTPMFSTLLDISSALDSNHCNTKIIADGGVREPQDVCKALVAGADMVMVGSAFAALKDSPARLNRHGMKEYFGSASFHTKGHNRHVEGTLVELTPNDLTYLEYIDMINGHIRSCMSYANVTKISDLKHMQWGVWK